MFSVYDISIDNKQNIHIDFQTKQPAFQYNILNILQNLRKYYAKKFQTAKTTLCIQGKNEVIDT